MFCCPSVRDLEQKILINCVHFYKFWKNGSLESWYFSYEKSGIHILNLKKQKKVYVTVLILILYSIWVHKESPKYKMICLKSPKSS